MDSATPSTATASRADTAARPAQRSAASDKPPGGAAEPKRTDASVTVTGRFDPDLRRFFVTILDTSSQTLITQFPSQAVARYVQQLKKAVAAGETPPKDADRAAFRDPPGRDDTPRARSLNRTT